MKKRHCKISNRPSSNRGQHKTHVSPPIRPPREVQKQNRQKPPSILRHQGLLHRRVQKVLHRPLLTPPVENIRSKPIICEPLRRVQQRILRQFQKHEIVIPHGSSQPLSIRHLIRVMLRRQPAKPRLDRAVISHGRHAQRAIEVAVGLDLVEGLVQRVEEVAGNNADKDASTMARIPWRRRLGSWFASANCDAVVDALQEGCRILLSVNSCRVVYRLG